MSFKLLLTNIGKQKIANASNVGTSAITISQFAVGQGKNVDFSKRLDKQTLVSKRYQGDVASVKAVNNKPNYYEILCVIPVDVGGFTVRELGLFDEDGDLIWVGNLPEAEKPNNNSQSAVDYRIKATIQINNPDVTLIVDTNVVTATQGWVEDNFIPKSALELIFPIGYKYWTKIKQNPKPMFDVLFGYETHWRRLKGVHLVAVDDNDLQINRSSLYVGESGDVTPQSNNPQQYLGYTDYLWERYDPTDVPVRYDGNYKYDGTAQYQQP